MYIDEYMTHQMNDIQLQWLIELVIILIFLIVLGPFAYIYKYLYKKSTCTICSHEHHANICIILTDKTSKVPEEYNEYIKVPTGKYQKIQRTIQRQIPDGTEFVDVTKYKDVLCNAPTTQYRIEIRQSTIPASRFVTRLRPQSHGGFAYESVLEYYCPNETVSVPYQAIKSQHMQVPYTEKIERPKYKTQEDTIFVDEEIMETKMVTKTRLVDKVTHVGECLCEECKCETCTISMCYFILCSIIRIWCPLLLMSILTVPLIFHLNIWYYFAPLLFIILILSILINKWIHCNKL